MASRQILKSVQGVQVNYMVKQNTSDYIGLGREYVVSDQG